jgi:hypothetical protein
MKSFSPLHASLGLCLGIFIAGCTTRPGLHEPTQNPERDMRPGVQAFYPEEIMFVSSTGAKAAFSAREFVEIAEAYSRSHGLADVIAGQKPSIWVDTSGSRTIAGVWYSTKDPWKALQIEIDRDGRAFKHQILTGVCGDSGTMIEEEKSEPNPESCVRPERSGAVNTTHVEQAREDRRG